MNREDIIRMAKEAQMPFYWRTGEITYLDKLETFAALVASAAIKEVLAQPEQDGKCKYCTDGCPACDARKLTKEST